MLDDSWDQVATDLLDVYPTDRRLVLKESHRRITHVAHGWFMRIRGSCLAVFLLRDSGLAAEAWPMRRAALEHVLALQWLAEQGDDARDVVVRTHGESSRKRQEAAAKAGWLSAGWPVWSEVRADAEAAVGNASESHMLANVRERCRRYGLPGDYAAWLIETNNSHPGWETASPYVQPDPLVLKSEALWDGSLNDAEFCARRMYRALSSLSAMMQSGPWDARMPQIEARMRALPVSDDDPDAGRIAAK